MKKVAIWVLVVALCFNVVSARAAESIEPEVLYVMVKPDSSLSLRASPDGKILEELPRGKRVEVIKRTEDGWVKIYTGTRKGYVFEEYLREYPTNGVRFYPVESELPEAVWSRSIGSEELKETYIEVIDVDLSENMLKAYLSTEELYLTSPVATGKYCIEGEFLVERKRIDASNGVISFNGDNMSCSLKTKGSDLVSSAERGLIQKDFYRKDADSKIHLPFEVGFLVTQYSRPGKTKILIH